MKTNFLGAEFGCWLSRASYSIQFTEEKEKERKRERGRERATTQV